MMISAYYPDAVSVFTLPRVRRAPVPLGLVGSAAFVSLVTVVGVGGGGGSSRSVAPPISPLFAPKL